MVDAEADNDGGSGVRWLTYEEAGKTLGIDAESVARRARRLRWRRQPGNDKRTLVAVPLDAIPDVLPDKSGEDRSRQSGDDVSPDIASAVRALEGEAATLREALEHERERVGRAEMDAREARRREADARERAAKAEGLHDALLMAASRAEIARKEADAWASQEAVKAAQAQHDRAMALQQAEEARRQAEATRAVLDAYKAMPWWRRMLYRPE